jgi:hypothetical protein
VKGGAVLSGILAKCYGSKFISECSVPVQGTVACAGTRVESSGRDMTMQVAIRLTQ